MIGVAEIRERVRGHTLVREVNELPTGPIRIETAFLYPDGSSVDLFVTSEENSLCTRLSDLGQTHGWLLDVQIKPWLSKRRTAYLEDTIRLYEVEQIGGELRKSLANLDHLIQGLVSLGQACVRVADLSFTKRSALVTPFAERVEEVLGDVEMPYASNVELEGRHGNHIQVDFLVAGPRVDSAIMGLCSGSRSQAHALSNEIFIRWYELNIPERKEQRITLFDDSVDVYRDHDLERLRDVSDVVALSDPQTLRDLLAA